MAIIYDRQGFADYCLRQLGGGVVNIEITPDQIDDVLDDSVQYYQDFHYEGIDRDYIKFQVELTKVTVASATGFAVDDVVTTVAGASATIVSITGNIIEVEVSTTGIMFKATHTLTNGTASSLISKVELGTVDKGYIDIPDQVFSVIKVVNTNSILGGGGDILFNVQYQIMSNEIRNITAGQANYLYTTMNYLGHLDFILRKEKSYRFNRRMNKLFYDDSWEMKAGQWYVFECYVGIDPETYSEVYNDVWLKKYTTAKMKRIWGTNLKKYSGMTLPGGATYSGQQIYDEAVQEIMALEQEASGQGAPLGLFVG